MTPTVYTCSGSCHGVVTKEQYESGAKMCGAESCELKGQPLVPLEQCEPCKAAGAMTGKAHFCTHCKSL